MNYNRQLRERQRANRRAHKIEAAKSFLAGAGLDAAWDIYQSTTDGYEERIIRDIVGKLVRDEGISEKQTNFIAILVQKIGKRGEREAQRAAEDAAAEPFPVTDERTFVEGEVLHTKVGESPFGGPSYKMLVRADAGWKVWVTNPAAAAEKGDRIRFQAKLQVSRDDPKFGFGSRPSKFEVLERAFQPPPEPTHCPHGKPYADGLCDACCVASDFAYDAARGS